MFNTDGHINNNNNNNNKESVQFRTNVTLKTSAVSGEEMS